MELKEGLYVRYKYEGIIFIGKIKFISEVMCGLDETLQMDIDNCMEEILKKDIIKSSYNPIDLIEVGDYVNGKKVIDKWEEPSGAFVGQIFIKLDGEDTVPTMRKIKTVATKEQFEQIQYRIGD